MQLQEIALLIQLVGMAVEKSKNWLEFWQRVLSEIHDGRLVGVDHGHGS